MENNSMFDKLSKHLHAEEEGYLPGILVLIFLPTTLIGLLVLIFWPQVSHWFK